MKKATFDILFIVSTAGLLFIPFLGAVHLFDWDEINFAECAREMIVTGDYFRVHINYLPFWEKPPFFFWLQAFSMHLFGINEFAARLPNAVCGILTLVSIYLIGKKLHGIAFGRLWALVYVGSVLPQLYFHSGIIDPWLNLFIFLGIYYFYQYYNDSQQHKVRFILLSGFFVGLGLITKGPVSLIIFSLVVIIFWATTRFRSILKFYHAILFFVAFGLVSVLWYGYEVYKNGFWFLKEFIEYNYRLFSTPDAGHKGFPGYHVVVLLLGCFPASFFYVLYLTRFRKTSDQSGFHMFQFILFMVVLVLFSIVKSKIVHYSSLCYFPLTYGASLFIQRKLETNTQISHGLKWSIASFLLLLSMVLMAFPYLAAEKTLLRSLLQKDAFALANLEADVHWTGIEWTVGLFGMGVSVAWIFYLGKTHIDKAIYALFGGMTVLVTLILFAFIGRIEQFTQGANIQFFKNIAHEDAYVVTVGYRSYAHYFYGAVKPENSPMQYKLPAGDTWAHTWRHALLYDKNDKPIYMSAKITSKDELMTIPNVQILGSKNGWIFARKPKSKE